MRLLYTTFFLFVLTGSIFSQSANPYSNLEYEMQRQFDPYNQTGQFNEEFNKMSSSAEYILSLIDSLYSVQQEVMGMSSISNYLGNDTIKELVMLDQEKMSDRYITPTHEPAIIDSSTVTEEALMVLGVMCNLLEIWTEHTYTKYYYSKDYPLVFDQFKHHEITTLFECSKITKALPLRCEYEYFTLMGPTRLVDHKYILVCKKLPKLD